MDKLLLLAPRHGNFEYYYRLFGDLLEITHLELDRVLEISEYMEQQEDIIKFRSEHYNEYGYQSIQNRQATPLIQCNQNLQGSSCVKSPSSPEYSKASSSEDTEDSETDDSDTASKLPNNMHGLCLPAAVTKKLKNSK